MNQPPYTPDPAAVVALERSQAATPPGPRTSGLLDALIDQVVPPSAWPDLRNQIRRHADPHARDVATARDSGRTPAWEAVDRPAIGRPPNPPCGGRKPPAPGIAI